MKIVLPDPIDLSDKYLQEIKGFGAESFDEFPKNKVEIIERIKDAEIITANYIDITPEIIDGAPKLKYIIVPAVGYDWIDVKYAAAKGIRVLNCPTFNSQAVAEHAITLLFAVCRQILPASESLRSGNWEFKPFVGHELAGKSIGLVGYGNIGKKIDNLANGIGMTVSYVNSASSTDDFEKLIINSDVICICAALNDKTRHLFDRKNFSLLKKDAILINVGRGAIIDQPALIKVLKSKSILGAGLDVFENESLTGKPNKEIVELANLYNVVAVPHIGYYTVEAADKLGQELIGNVKSIFDGKPKNIVN